MPLPVLRGVVEALMAYCDPSGLCPLDRDLQPRQVVRVVAGPFGDTQAGSLRSMIRVGRALLEVTGGAVMATLERVDLQRA